MDKVSARRGERTRNRIIRHAAAVFNRRGYAGTALSDLMQATGLCKGGIYRHFAGKQELAMEAFRFAWKQAFEPRLAHIAGNSSGMERLQQMVANFVNQPPPGVRGGCPLMNLAVDADDTNPQLLGIARQAYCEWRKAVESFVQLGQRKGEIREDVSPRSVSRFLIGALEGALLLSQIEGSRRALLEAQTHLEQYLQSLAKGSSKPPGKRAVRKRKSASLPRTRRRRSSMESA